MAILKLKKPLEGKLRYSLELNKKVDEVIDLLNSTVVDGVISQTGGTTLATDVEEFTVLKTITTTEIVGSDTGDIGGDGGCTLVSAPTSGYTLELVSVVAVYDFNTAAYTGGANDLVVKLGNVAMTGVCTTANLLGAAGDKIVHFKPLSTAAVPLTVGTAINLNGTAYTNPGTAAGVLRVYTTYRKIKTNL